MKAGWPVKPVGDLCEIIGGGTPSKSNAAFFNGGIPWATVRDMKGDWIDSTEHSITSEAVKNSATHILPSGTVVIASRVGLGKICRIREATAINQDLRGFIPKAKAPLDIQYLFWWFKSVAGQIVAAGNGATVQGVTLPFLRSLQIPLPPLGEQRRIVAVLDQACAGIATATANAQKNLTNARAVSKRHLDLSFEECATDGNLHRLSDIMDISHGFAFRGEDFSKSVDEAKPIVLTPGNYTENAGLDFSPSKTKRLANVPPKDFKFKVGDLTIVMTDLSSKMKILGKPAFIDRLDVLHNQRIGRVIFKTDAIEARLVYHFLRSEVPLRRIRDTATGTMVRHTAPSRILSNVIAVPKSAIEQTAMVARLDDIDENARRLETLYTHKIAALSELKQALLQKAFAGERA